MKVDPFESPKQRYESGEAPQVGDHVGHKDHQGSDPDLRTLTGIPMRALMIVHTVDDAGLRLAMAATPNEPWEPTKGSAWNNETKRFNPRQFVTSRSVLDHVENGFGAALSALRHGHSVQRRGWNGPGQYLTMQVPDAHSKMTLPYIYITTVQGDRVPWLASQTDLLASDWLVYVVPPR